MLEAELIEAFEPRFRDFLNNVGGTLKAFRREPARPGPDLLINAVIRGKPITLVAEAKAQGEPRYIRQAADQLRDFMGRPRRLSHRRRALHKRSDRRAATKQGSWLLRPCRQCFDRCRSALHQPGWRPNPKPAQKALKSLFAPKTSRVVRVLLTNPGKTWYVQDLAAEAAVSIGLASRLKKRLVDLELLGETKAGVSLAKPGDLLDLWAKEYSYQKNRILSTTLRVRRQTWKLGCPSLPDHAGFGTG